MFVSYKKCVLYGVSKCFLHMLDTVNLSITPTKGLINFFRLLQGDFFGGGLKNFHDSWLYPS